MSVITRPSPLGGNGMFLTNSQSKEDVIFQEEARMQMFDRDGTDRATRLQKIRAQFQKLTPQEMALFNRLHHAPLPEPADELNKFYVNALGPFENVVRLFLKYMTFNHSCVPNARTDWESGLKEVQIELLEDVPAGIEITIDYYDTDATLFKRQLYLKKNWGITCRCPKCLREGVAGRAPS